MVCREQNLSVEASRSGVLGAWAEFLERIFPHPFTLALFLTVLTSGVALVATPATASELVTFWGDGMWDFLKFAMQMLMVLVTGQALAESPLVSKVLQSLASWPKTMSQAVVLVSVAAMVGAWLNWGFGLIVGALLARQVSDRLAACLGEASVSRGLLGAAGYSGLAFWHCGISGSAPLAIAGAGHRLEGKMGVVGLEQTVYSTPNLILAGCLLLSVPLVLVLLSRFRIEDSAIVAQTVARDIEPEPRVSWMARFLVLLVALLAVVWWVRVRQGFGLNSFIFLFLFLGLVLHGSPTQYARAIDRSMGGVGGIVLQFPFYAGIAAIASKSGLVALVSTSFVTLSSSVEQATGFQPFLVFVFLSAGVANLFVPSGGGQWIVQGPIAIEAAQALSVSPSSATMAVAYGDQWTNLLQPFWALPLLSITGLKPAQLMAYTSVLLVWMGGLTMIGLVVLF